MVDSNLVKFGDFVLNPNSRKLFDNQKVEILLTPTIFSLLELFIRNPNKTISKREIKRTVWKDKKVLDANINQNIRKLRHLLCDSAYSPVYIETVIGEGYRFLQAASEYSPPINKTKQIYQNAFIFIAMVLTAFIWVVPKPGNLDTPPKVSELKPLTTFKGINHYPSLSSDGKYLLFNNKQKTVEDWDIILKPIDKEIYYEVAATRLEESFPTLSPDNKTLAYFAKGHHNGVDYCGLYVRKIKLNPVSSGEPKLLKKCSGPRPRLHGEWISNTELFIGVHDDVSMPGRIIYLNLNTKAERQITNPDVKGFGDYAFKYSKEMAKLAYVRNVGWSSTEIWTYDLNSHKHQRIKSLPNLLRGVDWDNDWIYFASGERQLSRISVTNSKEEYLASTPRTLYTPFVIAKNKIGIETGDMYISDVARINAKTKENTVAVASSLNDYGAVGFGQSLAFFSDRTGQVEVWMKYPDGAMSQLTHYSKSFELNRLSVHAEKELIMFNESGTTVIINFEGETIFRSDNYSSHPHGDSVFDIKNNRILYSTLYDSEWYIETRELDNFGETTRLFKAETAKPCLSKDCIYYFKDNDPTLYRYEADSNSSQAVALVGNIFSMNQWEIVDESTIFFIEENNQKNQITEYNFINNRKSVLVKTRSKAFSYDRFNESIYIDSINSGSTNMMFFEILE